MWGYALGLAWKGLGRFPKSSLLAVMTVALGLAAAMCTLTLLHVLSTDPLPGRSQHLYSPYVDTVQGRLKGIWKNPANGVQWQMNVMKPADAQALLTPDRSVRQAALLPAVQKILQHRLGPRLGADTEPIRVRSYAEARHASFSDNRSALYMLGGITLAVVLVTVMGVLGLSGFQVQRRQRQIGIYRALGARRRQIMSSFLGENLLLVGAASMLGMGLAWIINQLLMQHYELARLPPSWLPVGAVTAIVLGQLAVLGPARSAAGIAPAEAIRSQ